jgi:hypothetical protein
MKSLSFFFAPLPPLSRISSKILHMEHTGALPTIGAITCHRQPEPTKSLWRDYSYNKILVIPQPLSGISPPPPAKISKLDTTSTSVENPQQQSVIIKETNI